MKRLTCWILLIVSVHLTFVWMDRPTNDNHRGTSVGDQFVNPSEETRMRIHAACDRIEVALGRRPSDFQSKDFKPLVSKYQIDQIEKELNFKVPYSLRVFWARWPASESHTFPDGLYDAKHVLGDWRFHRTNDFGYFLDDLKPDHAYPRWEPHPAWVPFSGWDVYTTYVNPETGEVLEHDDDSEGARLEAESLEVWLENVAQRFENGADFSDFRTPGGEPW